MQRYILRRVIERVEKREIEVPNWEAAMLLLNEFREEPANEDKRISQLAGTAEYVGDN